MSWALRTFVGTQLQNSTGSGGDKTMPPETLIIHNMAAVQNTTDSLKRIAKGRVGVIEVMTAIDLQHLFLQLQEAYKQGHREILVTLTR